MGQYTIADQYGSSNPTSGTVIREKSSGRLLTQDEWRGWDFDKMGKDSLIASHESDPSVPAAPPTPADPTPPPPTPGAPPPPPTPGGAGGGLSSNPAMKGLQGAMAAGWGNQDPRTSGATALGTRTPNMPVTVLSDVMRRFGRTY